ncbi:hypothetical protein HYH03_012292 [Edaphochlamys debaryana]|uniref:Uncharacterized protein n=1 Tax=Edaphochlamys debaryana TaxID=47281 RepID=A0A835XQJ7_9CHLO|nr:hypothetical protein HYH03_012292 [Edaphochlamys debaryana]|eukprot:KAG2489272.1 hypothetical protein HYH03_012292 [Edaphochlamys debaryana]
MPVEVDLLLLPNVVEGRYDWMSRQHEALMVPVPRLVTRALKTWHDGLDVSTVPNCGIGSVALEVLALAAHQQLRWQQKWQGYSRKDSPKVYQARLFQAALSLLVEAVEEGRVVTVDAGTWGSPRSPLDYQHCWAADPVKIIHPIDPTCNLAHQRPDKPTAQWQAVAAEAKELLDTFRTGTLGEVLGRLGPAMQLQRDRERAAWDRRLRLVLTSPDGWGTTAFRR